MNMQERIERLEIIWEVNDTPDFSEEEIILMAEVCIELKLDWRKDSSEESNPYKMFNAIINRPTVQY